MQKVTFTNARGETVELFQQPFFLDKIEGLGDVDADVQSQKSRGQNGSTPTITTLQERHIPIEVVILDNLLLNRQLLSKVFNPNLGPGTLTYQNDISTRVIQATSEHVPKFPDQRPRLGQRAIIDLICNDPYFRDEQDSKTEIALWEGNLEFPLEIPEEGMEVEYRTPSLIVNVENKGHVDTGMIIKFKALGTVINPMLLNVNTSESIKLNRTLVAGEVITVNTNRGKKRIESSLNGVTTNVFNNIVYGSTFLQLSIGDNLFRYHADDNEDALEVSIYHSTKYVGV